MVDSETGSLTWKRGLTVAVAWLAYVLAAHQILLHRHDLFVVHLPPWQALAVEVLLAFAVAVLVMMVVRAPRLNRRNAALIFLWVVLVVVGHYLAFIEEMNAGEILAMLHMDQGWKSLLLVSFLYALLIAIPFVPGLELGLAIIMLFDWQGSVVVYLSTIVGLSLAFLAGRHLPLSLVASDLQKNQASILGRVGPALRRYRYLALAVLLNLPGNSVLGGGGGIALASGLSRYYSWPGFLVTVIIATAPVPVMLLFGVISLDQLFA